MSNDSPHSSKTKRKNNGDETKTPRKIKRSSNQIQKETAFGNQIQTFRITLYDKDTRLISVGDVFDEVHDDLSRILKGVLKKRHEQIWFKIFNFCKTVQANINIEACLIDYEYVKFNFDANGLLNTLEDIEPFLAKAKVKIEAKYDDSIADKTDNQQIKQFQYVYLDVYGFHRDQERLLRLPSYLEPYVFNITSNGKESFVFSILSGLHPDIDNPNEQTLEPFINDIVMNDVNCDDVQLDDLPRIEKDNSFSVNVYMLQYLTKVWGGPFNEQNFNIEGPVYHTKGRKENHINLLLITNRQTKRFYLIKDLKKAIKKDVKVGELICDGCLNFYEDERKLERHQMEDCLRVKTIFKEGKFMKFSNEQNEIRAPFVVYADFESLLQVVNNVETDDLRKRDSYKKNTRKHVPHSSGYYIKCFDYKCLSDLQTNFREQDTMEHFIKNLIKDLKVRIEKYYAKRRQEIEYVPIFVHNLKGYDSHFIMRAIPCTSVLGNFNSYFTIYKEFSTSFGQCQLRFMDSMKFLKDSLAVEVSKLDTKSFIAIRKLCRTEADLPYLCRKGVFPYEYIKSMENFEERSLPPKDQFYDSLKELDISDDDYEHALSVWRHFKCKTIGEYSDLYLTADILLLADAFENLRDICMTNYGLDPAHYYSLSGFSWDAMLKHTGVELEPLSDVDMLTFIKKGIRGGVALCSKRYAVANNKYLPETYNQDKQDTHIMYYDANNLYGHTMSQPLPYGGLEWVDPEVDYKLPEGSPIGYILEVDLSYPLELHDSHSDLPFCPEKKNVPGANKEMSFADLLPKRKYIIHYSYLALCEEHGLKVDKIHRVLKFNQKPWLKPYIDFNTSMRMEATSESEKDFYKLVNNSVFGNSIRNIEKYQTIKVSHEWDDAFKWIGRPNYSHHTLCSEAHMTTKLSNTSYRFEHPLYVGFCILDMSKAHMYNFHYNVMKPKFGDNLKLLYIDTDSFIYQIETPDYYAAINEKDFLNKYFDTDDYEEDNIFQIPKMNKKKVGYFKDQMNGAIVKEFVALRPKMYTVDAVGKTIKKAAGVPRHITERFQVADYKNCLFKNESSCIEFNSIGAVRHDVFQQRVKKKGLSPEYLNRRVLENLVDTLPWGHYRLNDEGEHF